MMLRVGEGVGAGVSGAGAEGVLGGKVMGQGSLGHAGRVLAAGLFGRVRKAHRETGF